MKANILIAFPYFTDTVRKALSERDPSTFRLMVDSGAFTAHTQGHEIKLDEYHTFLKSLPKSWEKTAIQLDVIGNPEESYKNLMRSVDAGFKMMPVFTRGDKIENVERLYEVGDYILFGGNVGQGMRKPYFKYFMNQVGKRKVHWLGVVDTGLIKAFRPFSVDSSSASGGQRFAAMPYYVGGGKLKTSKGGKNLYQRPPQEYIDATLRIGFSMKHIKELGQKSAWVGGAARPNDTSNRGLAAFISYCHHVLRAWDVERHLKTRVYHAASNDGDMNRWFWAREFLQERRIIT